VNIGITLLALVVGFMAATGGSVSAVSLWSGRRAGAAGLVGFDLASLLGSMAVSALLLWLVWLLVRGRLTRE
jgi:hypothetical protein